MYFVYILRSLLARKTYIGHTSKLPTKRLYEHDIGSNAWTACNGPFELIYFEAYVCKADEILREKYLKSGMGNKLISLIRDNFNNKYISSVSPTGRPRVYPVANPFVPTTDRFTFTPLDAKRCVGPRGSSRRSPHWTEVRMLSTKDNRASSNFSKL